MHFHAEHALFFDRPQSLWRAALSFALTVCVLVANTWAGSSTVSLLGASVGLALLLGAYVRGHRRLEPVLAWTLSLVALALLGGLLLTLEIGALVETASRVLCGMVWILWLGTQLDWSLLRRLLLAARVPENVVGALDHAWMHGVLTRGEWGRRRDAARSRLGEAKLPLVAWARLLGEGALHSFFRLESVEEGALLRSASGSGGHEDHAFRLSGVNVERGKTLVLEGLDLEVERGECLLLCGTSGAGKSSLLRLLAGLDAPGEGTMTRFGTSVGPASSLKNRLDGRVVLLSQNPEHHFIANTVAEDVAWGLVHRGVSADEAERRSAEIAKAMRIEHLLMRPCHELSFGEQRRAALAGLLVLEPSLLLLDEPTAGLDPVAAHELRTLVQESIRKRGAACVWATHNMHAVPDQAKRVVLLRDRHILFDGPTDEGLSRPWMLKANLATPQEGEVPC